MTIKLSPLDLRIIETTAIQIWIDKSSSCRFAPLVDSTIKRLHFLGISINVQNIDTLILDIVNSIKKISIQKSKQFASKEVIYYVFEYLELNQIRLVGRNE